MLSCLPRIVAAMITAGVVLVTLPTHGQNAPDAKAMIDQMRAARLRHVQIASLTQTYGAFSMQQAYRIQAALAAQLVEMLGPVAGCKVAYASKAAQEQFGIAEPVRGPLFLSQRTPNASMLPAGLFNEITLETEVAFTIGKRIDKPIKDVAELKALVKWVHAAFDAGDSPFTADGAKPNAQDMVAIGAGSHVFVLGPAVDPAKVDIDAIDLALARNGDTIRRSPARNVMGSPWNSLLWCANHLVRSGQSLEPGMVVLCGTAAPAYKATGVEIKGDYVGDCGPLGKVTLTIK